MPKRKAKKFTFKHPSVPKGLTYPEWDNNIERTCQDAADRGEIPKDKVQDEWYSIIEPVYREYKKAVFKGIETGKEFSYKDFVEIRDTFRETTIYEKIMVVDVDGVYYGLSGEIEDVSLFDIDEPNLYGNKVFKPASLIFKRIKNVKDYICEE